MARNFDESTSAWNNQTAFEFGNNYVFSSASSDLRHKFNFQPPNSAKTRIQVLEREISSLKEATLANVTETTQLRETIEARNIKIANLTERNIISDGGNESIDYEAARAEKKRQRDDLQAELQRLRMELNMRDGMIAALSSPISGGLEDGNCSCGGDVKSLQEQKNELEATTNAFSDFKIYHRHEINAKDKVIKDLKDSYKQETTGKEIRIQLLQDEVDKKEDAKNEEARLHQDFKAKFICKTEDVNDLTEKVETLNKDVKRLNKKQNKTFENLEASRETVINLEEQLKRERNAQDLQVNKRVQAIVGSAAEQGQELSGKEKKASNVLSDQLEEKVKKIDTLQGKLEALEKAFKTKVESERKLKKELAQYKSDTVESNENFTVVQGKKNKHAKQASKMDLTPKPADSKQPLDAKLFDGFTTNTGAEQTYRKGPGGRKAFEKVAQDAKDRWNERSQT